MMIDNWENLIDVRDVIKRYEELRDELFDDDGNQTTPADWDTDDREEWDALSTLLGELKSNGGDEQWEGDWYPVTLIRDSYFEDYAQQLAEDIGAIDPDAGWPTSYVDWERAASELQMDYSSVDFDGTTYWYR